VITLKSHGKKVVDIEENSFGEILNIYPDEHLNDRQIFKDARETGELSYTDLRSECDKLLIPWQIFLLKPDKLAIEIKQINDRRKSKFDKKLIANRSNEGEGVSLRIADRLISLQEYVRDGKDVNEFPGILKNIHRDKWATIIVDYFQIDLSKLRAGRKEIILGYLIASIEEKDIRIARGVLTHKLLPASNAIRATYRKSSGFVVRDSKVPYIFLPSEISDNETPGRQILTLLTLVVLIGLDNYNMYVTGSLEMFIKNNRALRQAYDVVSEILLPFSETEKFSGIRITEQIRDDLASKFMLTPSAVVVTLRQRGLIDNDVDYQALLDDTFVEKVTTEKQVKRTPHLDTAVRKLCGSATHNDIIEGIKTGVLSSTKVQYLIFGRIDKLKYEKYKVSIGI